MKSIAAKEAKNNFGELMDTAQREPVTIERRGRAVVVVISATEYEKIKLERLRARLAIGEAQADRGEFVDQSLDDMLIEFKKERNAKKV